MERHLKLSFIFFLIITCLILFTILEAYSTLITISEVQPLPRRGNIQYNLEKQGLPYLYTEVRSITLTLSGNDVDSATVQWYRRLRPLIRYYYVTVSVTLIDDGGNTISSGSQTFCLRGWDLRSDSVPLTRVNIDEVAVVRASADIGEVCDEWEPPIPIPPEPLDLDEGLGGEI